MSRVIHESQRETPIADRADVVVVGGGPGGIGAALGAVRNGADTILIEKEHTLGGYGGPGLMSVGYGSGSPECSGRVGIAKELFDRMKEMNGSTGYRELLATTLNGCPSPQPLFHYRQWRPIIDKQDIHVYNPELLQLIALETLQDAGVRIFLHTLMVDTIVDNSIISGVITESKSGRQAIKGKVFVDATKDADVVARSGSPFQEAHDPRGRAVPMGIMYKMSGVDVRKLWAYQRETDSGLEKLIEKARLANELPYYRPKLKWREYSWDYSGHSRLEMSPLKEDGEILVWGGPVPYDLALSGTKAEDLTRAEINLRRQIFSEVNFLRKYVPGFEKAYLTVISPMIGVRESRHPIGEYVLTIEDIERRRAFDDVVLRRSTEDEMGRSAELFEVPYRSLLPKSIHNLILGGENISADHLAFLQNRGVVTCLVSGQVAGIAAALCISSNVKPRDLNVAMLQRKLAENGLLEARRTVANSR
jgi:2-polyprenyl-6-methoxyphenol hydroxylase-like FAD-dependent oxidoreductase